MTDAFYEKLNNAYKRFLINEGVNYASLPTEVTREQAENFYTYMQLLVEWNEKMNLTAITDEDGVIYKHFLDSLTSLPAICSHFDAKLLSGGITLIDVGTGAGFPGLAIAIMMPDIHVTLLDSLAKRISFLDEVVRKLSLTNVTTIHSRAEDGCKLNKSDVYGVAEDGLMRESFDIAIARAVASMPLLSEYLIPYVRVGGYFISMKSQSVDEEILSAGKAIKILGCDRFDVHKFRIDEIEAERSITCAKKVYATPPKYPRKAGLPAKKPLV